ncbi:MAG: two-component system sensor histidine kinase CreC [Verrucomicrobia bacterium]|nr:two-component system sensor histidine kinase CreC [Verrucomicrobiota bacterium]MDA1085427.1 two-component system sensor histidine kinase CreC [Verrucomicrobiota bacterium]
MRIRTRIIIAFLIPGALGFYFLVDWVLDDVRPRYLEAMEESMIDMATILATALSDPPDAPTIDATSIDTTLRRAKIRVFDARIYGITKEQIDMRVYVTDTDGIVIYDSDHGRAVGDDYSNWNDVYRTLRAEYGARATRSNPDDPTSSILHVAAPVYSGKEIIGSLTVSKPTGSLTLFMEAARRKVVLAGLVAFAVVIVLGAVLSVWITRPIEVLTRYAKAVRDGRRPPPPAPGSGEIGDLGDAFEEMRDALEGKQYVEGYVQTLTHEMKSPISAVRGAAELLDEDMPVEKRRQFLANIRSETNRMQDLVDRMLLLSSLETRKALHDVEPIDLASMITDVISSLRPQWEQKSLSITSPRESSVTIHGEAFLIRHALTNLVGNAIDFAPTGSAVSIELKSIGDTVAIEVADAGPGVPPYACDKIFDRFYSIERPATGRKSTGLGLVIAREAAELHSGTVELVNAPSGGAIATLRLPLESP